ncbi:MAG: GntR family transcriptional regulator [Porticoccaceae bacterium]
MKQKAAIKTPPRKEKLSAQVARKIEHDIVKSGWQPGTILGTEAELITRYGVSRAVLREAISQVERKGIAKMRRGHGGGLVVADSARTATIHALGTYLELVSADLRDMLEARFLLDLLSAPLACRNISEEAAEELRDKIDRLSSNPASLEEAARLNLDIRQLVAAVSGNPLVSLFSDAIDYSCSELVVFQFGELYIFKEFRAETAAVKSRLGSAIIDADEFNALKYTRQNIDAQMAYFKNHLDKTRAQLHSSEAAGAQGTPLKLGHSIALRISDDIRTKGLRAGARLGSEPELMAKYDVSRAAFREAVRLLEAHAIVQARRGSGGGLTVGAADPSNVIDTVILYMDVMNIQPATLIEVREALEVGAIRMAVQKMTADDEARIVAALEASADFSKPEESFYKAVMLHQAISNASHNATLALLLQATLFCLARTYDIAKLNVAWLQRLYDSHSEMVDALLARNEGLAVRKMLSYLEMVKGWWLEQHESA